MYHILSKHIKLILLWGVIGAVIAGAVSLVINKQYSADAQVLIISRDRSGVDPYTQAKSAERIGENLVQVMKTTDFYSKVMESGYNFNKNQWTNLSDREQRKKWADDVQGSMIYGTGLMNVRVYGSTKDDALALSNAVVQTLAGRGWEYLGGDVAIKAVNTALISRLPGRPNFPVNMVFGFIVGFAACGIWIVRYKRSLFGL